MMVFIFVLLCVSISGTVSAAASYQLTVDGQKTNLTPVVVKGSTMVPLKALLDAINFKVSYDSKAGQVTGKRGAKTISVLVRSQSVLLNGVVIPVRQKPVSIRNTVYVPVRFADEVLGAEVELNSVRKIINIRTLAMDLTVKEELPARNDHGEPITLQHRGNIKLKWWFQSESPYENYNGFMGSNETLIFQSYGGNGTMIMNLEGEVLSSKNDAPVEVTARYVKVPDGYDIWILENKKVYIWKGIPLYFGENVGPIFIAADGKPIDGIGYVDAGMDREGNLIVLTTDGLAAFDRNGKRLWVHKEWQTKDGILSAFSHFSWSINGIVSDHSNNLYIQLDGGHVVLDAQGKTVLVEQGFFMPEILEDDTLLYNQSSYRLEDGKIKRIAAPYGDDGFGQYIVSQNHIGQENWVKRMNETGDKALWTYQLSNAKQRKGYSLMGHAVDGGDNVYVLDTGGGVHSLNRDGALRFALDIDNNTISWAEIIPISASELVVVDDNLIMFFEIQNE
ncbi:copper amine oxidase N-terminal domain-containing protein [Cohnella cellulosilytica]